MSAPARRRRAVATAAMAALLAAGCSSPEQGGRSPAGERTDAAPTGRTAPSSPDDQAEDRSVARRLEALAPVVPDVRQPRSLARRLELLGAVLNDPEAAPGAVRRAAELEQVATRTLGMVPEARTRAVVRLLPVSLRRKVRSDVAAARALGALAEPQPQLPDWRVVEPPSQARLMPAYRAAERRTGVGWEFLAGIHLVETRMGRIRGTSTAGAQGPMQFLPTTWDIYGAGGDINDHEDAIMAAGRLLRANGAPQDMRAALFSYNQSSSYVLAVMAYAANMRRAPLAYRGYWHWRVLYRHVSGTKVLPVGYPRRPAVPLARS